MASEKVWLYYINKVSPQSVRNLHNETEYQMHEKARFSQGN
jgi:hypothetical protein